MEISLLKVLLNGISSFLHLSISGNKNTEPVSKYYGKAEETLKLLKPIVDALINSELSSDEVLNKAFDEVGQAVDELRELFGNWHPLSSKVYFVMQAVSLISKIQTSGLDIFQQLKSSHLSLPDELSTVHVEHCVQKLKLLELGNEEDTLVVIKEAINEQVEGVGPSSEVLANIAESLGLRSNQEILIEAVALEKLKENAEQADKTAEAEYIDQMITLITRMHERLVTLKQAQSSSPVPVPPDFCCPLSLELMTDPVIVASGQTYERAFIKNWIDLGITVCPKTRQTLAHTNLIPNYTVKALIANWCESNNVKPVDPVMSKNLNQASFLHGYMESGAIRESPVFAPSRVNQPSSPESARSRSFSSPGKSLTSSGGIHKEGTSPFHPRSTSEGSLSGMANGQGLDIARISLTASDDRSASSDERSEDSIVQPSISQSITESSNALSSEPSQTHLRTASESSAISTVQEAQGDGNSASQPSSTPGNSKDASMEANSGPDATGAAAISAPQREPEIPTRLVETRSRNQSIWRRPSERSVPRVLPSSAETRADLSGIETQVRSLVEDLKTSSLETQREATAKLRLLAKHNMDNRLVIANCGAINLLVDLLQSTDAMIQENAVTALLNLSINDNNKTAIANAGAIDPLIVVLETGSPEAKENSAATLFSLSVIEENKIRIGRSGAIKPLVDLLGNGTPRGKKDAATALFNLSIYHENKGRIVQAGAVKHLVDLMDPAAGMVDKAVAVLANLATIPEGRNAIGEEGGIPVLVEVVELGSARGKENAAAALLHLCLHSNRYLGMVLQEGAVPPLVALSQSGTPRAKEKAQALLNQFRSQRHGNAGRN